MSAHANHINQSNRDFEKEYNELMQFVKKSLDHQWRGEHEWNKQGDYIKKFSLLKESPTPIITNNIFTD